MLVPDTRLVTADILYQMPDYRNILQTFVWQDLDIFPELPKLFSFLDFWDREIEGPIVRVTIGETEIFKTKEWRNVSSELIH